MRQCKIKIGYVLLLIAYMYIFICMPSLHCHFQFIDNTPHCHHCHVHITFPVQSDDHECYFCPIINFNTISLPAIILIGLLLGLLYFRPKQNDSFIKNTFILYFSSRAPPYMF